MKRNVFQSLVRLLAALALCALPALAQTTELPALSAVTRDLKGGETHSYRLSLTSGQFIHVTVEQLDIDLVTAVFTPDGKPLTESDSPNDRWGSEPIIFVAPLTGEYRVDVKSTNKQAPAGRYEIKIVALREATAADKGHATAQLLFDEARKLRAQQGAPPKRAAIEKYQQALPLFEAAGDSYRTGLTLLSIGISYFRLNQFRDALGFFDQTLAIAVATGDLRLEAGAQTYAGGMLDFLGDIDKALERHQRALNLARKRRWQLAEGDALSNMGKIYSDVADWQKALEFYNQALAVFRSMADGKQREAVTLNNIGMAYSRSGEQEKALEYLQQAFSLHYAAENKQSEAATLTNIGVVYRIQGDFQKAQSHLSQARAINTETGNRGQLAETLNEIGVGYSEDGHPDKAVEILSEAIQIHHATGNLRQEAIALSNLGDAFNRLKRPDAALQSFSQALTILRNIGDLSRAARTLEGIARAERSQGKLTEARTHIQESLALIETVRARAGSLQMRASYRALVEDAYEFYIHVLMEQHAQDPSHGFDAEALQASERARARSLLERLNEAKVDIREGVAPELVKKERELTQLLNAKAQREMQIKLRKGSNEELIALQREMSGLEDEYQQVEATIRQRSPRYSALTQPQPLGLKEIQQQLDADTILLEYALGEERSYLWTVTPNSLKAYVLPQRDDIQKLALQVYESLGARSVVKSMETPAQRSSRIVQADKEFEQAASELSRLILAPAAGELGNKRLVIVADGALQYVPFAALSSSGAAYQPLIVRHEIVSLPSASSFAVQRDNLANRPIAPKTLAVIADPVFSMGDPRLRPGAEPVAQAPTRIIEHLSGSASGQLSIPRLPFTRREADQILAVARAGANLKALDFRANRAMATSGELSKYRYVHFATHGYLDTSRAGLSAIVLSLYDENGKPLDGFLRTHDVYNLKLPAELVVLSACETGLGKDVRGEGLEGLTRGFMYAGARRVVVILWNVNDKATAALMQRLYTGMLRTNKTPAAALRAAQIEMLRTGPWQSPYYWAPFVMQGEWR
jgi:CHAT domain-containing protein/Tfp pilus assembly protein PilF